MSKLAIYVATTAGPVRIERIVGEDAPLSQVYQGRAYRPLEPVSADYARFVGEAGPVARALGPNPATSFRLEVSGPIGSGNSWELGFFVAHALARTGQLASPKEPEDRVVLLTGLVDVDLRLGPVGHIADKIAAAGPLLAEARERGAAVTFFLPRADLPAETHPSEGLEIVPAETASEVLGRLGSLPARLGVPTRRPRRRAVLALAGAIALASVAAIAVHQGLKSAKPLPAASPQILVLERRPPEGHNCAEVQFGKVDPRLVAVASAGDGALTPSRLNGLCGLVFSLDNLDRAVHAAAWIEVGSGRYLEPPDSQRPVGLAVPLDPARPWVIDLPTRMEAPFSYRLVVGLGDRPVDSDLDWLRRQVDRDRALKDLENRGLTLLTARHRVEP